MADTSMEQFFTRERANEGIEIPLTLPDGTKSKHWIRILGVDSDLFRAAETAEVRAITAASMVKDQEKLDELNRTSKIRLLSTLVIGWSFDMECTQDNVQHFLTEAPQIADAINELSSKRSLFFVNGSSKPSSMQRPNSGSTSSQKTRSSRTGQATSKSGSQQARGRKN